MLCAGCTIVASIRKRRSSDRQPCSPTISWPRQIVGLNSRSWIAPICCPGRCCQLPEMPAWFVRGDFVELLRDCLKHMPIVAILRGIAPGEVEARFDALSAAGIRIIEVPLNSPQALESIRLLAHRAGPEMLV